MVKSRYEVIVVGAGPAGSTAARLLGANDVETLLVEKEEPPRHKTCGGGLTDKTLRLMDRTFDRSAEELKQRGIINYSSHRVRLGFGERELKRFEIEDSVHFTDRSEYDHFLFREAKKAGTETLVGDGVDEIDFAANRLTTESGRTVEYGHLLAADGAHSPTRKALVRRGDAHCPYWSDQLAIALEAYVDRDEAPAPYDRSGILDLHLGVVNWGYGWVFPHENQLLVGVGGLKPVNPDIRESLLRYGQILGIDLSNTTIKGHPLPFGNYVRRPYQDNVLLLGDAGGFVDPLTGEGIFYAQRTGELAARAYLAGNGPGTARRYGRFVREHVLPEMNGAWRLRPFVYGGAEGIRRPLFSTLTNGGNPRRVMEIAHGHRVWHNLSKTGRRMHDTL